MRRWRRGDSSSDGLHVIFSITALEMEGRESPPSLTKVTARIRSLYDLPPDTNVLYVIVQKYLSVYTACI